MVPDLGWRVRELLNDRIFRKISDRIFGRVAGGDGINGRKMADFGLVTKLMQTALLSKLAAKYIWWKRPEEALQYPDRIVLQVMNIGDYDDVQELAGLLGDDTLRRVISSAEPGLLDERSWAYWHYRLGLAQPGKVPPLPGRRVDR